MKKIFLISSLMFAMFVAKAQLPFDTCAGYNDTIPLLTIQNDWNTRIFPSCTRINQTFNTLYRHNTSSLYPFSLYSNNDTATSWKTTGVYKVYDGASSHYANPAIRIDPILTQIYNSTEIQIESPSIIINSSSYTNLISDTYVGAFASQPVQAIFAVTSTAQGSLPFPVMTAAQFKSISSPIAGMGCYASDSAYYIYWNGSLYKNFGK